MHLLVLDNFDSFTFMLVDYLRQAGADCTVIRNDVPLASITEQTFDGVVLSPGPGMPGQAGNLLEVIAYYHSRLPLLGVCLGHQALGEFFGASLGLSNRPMHGKVSVIQLTGSDSLFQHIPSQFSVTRYHSVVVQKLPTGLQTLAETETGEIMAIRHRTWPIWGVQFHPEAVLTAYGLELLRNWIRIVENCVGSTKSKKKTVTSVAAL